jgi:hypothetical protein
VPYQYSKGILIRNLFVASIFLNDVHEEVRGIAKERMEELEKRAAKKMM